MRRCFFLLIILLTAIPAFAAGDSAIVLKTATGNIYGTLKYGSNPGKKATGPIVLIIPGSGPTDRDGNSLYTKNNAYSALADSLSAHGISSLRYDKRGIGESKAAANETDLRFDTYVVDARSWIKLLQQSGQFSSVLVLGHSEGALIGARAVQGTAKVSGFISVAGTAAPADTIILQQLEAGKQMPQTMLDSVRMYFRMVRNGDSLKGVPKPFYPIFRPSVVPYIASWIKYDPLKEMAAVKVPVLILQGTNDLQVPAAHYDLLMAAAHNPEGLKIEGMNHVLRNAPPERTENLATYSKGDLPLNAALVKTIVRFVQKHQR